MALKAQACAIGSRVAFLGTVPLLYLVAYQYVAAGARVAAVLDTSPRSRRLAAMPALAARPAMLAKGMYYAARLALWRIPVLGGVTPLAIDREKPNGGDERVARVRVLDAGGHERHFECDAEIGRAHVCTPVTNAHLVCRLLLENK